MNCTALQELAALKAIGALSPDEEARLQAVLAADPDIACEMAGLNETAAMLALALATPKSRPSPDLRSRILDQVRNRPQSQATAEPPAAPAGFHFILNDNSGWESTPLPGLRVKPLSVSRDMGYRVLLAHLQPGTKFPDHDHASSEELFILSGHLETEGRCLGPGDFLHAEPGTHHHELTSPDGCVALLIERAPATTS